MREAGSSDRDDVPRRRMPQARTTVEFVALVIWLLLAGLGIALVPFLFITAGAVLSLLAAVGGVTACVLFIVLDAPDWAGWVQFGLALTGILGALLAAVWLSDDRVISGSAAEGIMAGAIGLQLSLYCAVTFVTLLIAFEVTDSVV
jgi:hypothetical protein